MARTLKIDLFTDIVCPWCLVGVARLDHAVAALPEDVTVEIEHHPFYLDPDTPEEGVVVADMIREKYGREPETMWERAEAEAERSGIALDLSRQPPMFPTARAHTLIRAVKAFGTQHALATAITKAYFLDQRQVNDEDVLAELATAHGFKRDEAIRLINDSRELAITAERALAAAQQGVRGVPFFVFNGKMALSGAQPEAVFRQAFEQALAGSEA